MITDHKAICHKTCVCRYLGLIIYAFLLSRLGRQRTMQVLAAPGALRPGTRPFPAPGPAPQAPKVRRAPSSHVPAAWGYAGGAVSSAPRATAQPEESWLRCHLWHGGFRGQSDAGMPHASQAAGPGQGIPHQPRASSSAAFPLAAQHVQGLGTATASLPAATRALQAQQPAAQSRGAKGRLAPSPGCSPRSTAVQRC